MTLDTIDFDKKSMKGTDDGTAEALGRWLGQIDDDGISLLAVLLFMKGTDDGNAEALGRWLGQIDDDGIFTFGSALQSMMGQMMELLNQLAVADLDKSMTMVF